MPVYNYSVILFNPAKIKIINIKFLTVWYGNNISNIFFLILIC